MLAALLALVCAASGVLFVRLLWPRESDWTRNWLLPGFLSFGFGLGLFSIIFILSRAASAHGLLAVDLSAFALLLAGYVYQRKRSRPTVPPVSFSTEKLDTDSFLLVLRIAFVIALVAALYAAILRTIAHPHGDGWDAFAIWNLHARFLFRGGTHWRDGFSSIIPWSHPDYPLLLPAAIAHFWTGLGYQSQIVPAVIGLLFTFSTVGILVSSLALLRGQISANLAGLTLLSTPFFVEQGTAQYADVPLSFFILATTVLICLYERGSGVERSVRLPVLAGISCGFAAWTKNEGLLFLLAIVAARLLEFVIPRSRSDTQKAHSEFRPAHESTRAASLSFLAGTTPFLLLIAWFKHSVGIPNELFSSIAFSKLVDASRYVAILKWYGKDFLRFGGWFLIPGTLLLAGVYISSHGKYEISPNPGARACRTALALILAGYFLIYLITPYDLYWHLRFSLDRLFLQLWPAAIFLFFVGNRGFERGVSNGESVSK